MTADPIWRPDPHDAARSRLTAFSRTVAERFGVATGTYDDLWRWSVERPEQFWATVWDEFDVISDDGYDEVLADAAMPGARWFTGARLNYAEHALRRRDDESSPALIAVGEDGRTERVGWDDLRARVGAFAGWLRGQGVVEGDRVVGYLPNGVHAVVAFLASASIGAVWSACAQDYGAPGAAGRLSQLEPVVLVAADGYTWNGTAHDRREEVAALVELLPSVRVVVAVPHLGLDAPELPSAPAAVTWAEATAVPAEPRYQRVAFDAPLWVLFSSGTTGRPKGIVHGHGGVVVDHLRQLGLHLDLRPGDALLWYTSTNWMMWNIQVAALLAGATAVLYDGSPTCPGPERLWELAAEHRVAVLGVSPGFLAACMKAGLEPGRDLDLAGLRVLGSTGSPLPAAPFTWVRDHVGAQVQLVSTSGGTDVVTSFAGGAPTVPVWPGEISVPLLGVALDAWDAEGRPVADEVGELVVTAPMPSMPVRFWDDPDGSRYHDAYFSTFPGVWRHGDWVTRTSRGTFVVSGRSDSTLNRQGVRIGSNDIYEVVETEPEVREALVIGAELPDGGYWMPLFVVLEDGAELDDALVERIRARIRREASPRHVPDDVIAVGAVPHTRTGKKLEVPVKRLLQGASVDQVVSSDAVDDPAVLASFARYARG